MNSFMKQKSFALVLAVFGCAAVVSAQPSPQAVVDELLAADRAFSAASGKTDLVTGLSAMFASDVIMPNPAGIAYGSQQAIEALRANPANGGARIEWTPLRAAVSADGRHGFTAGFMSWHQASGVTTPLKYLAYWEKQQDRWRVLVYKRGAAKTMPPLTPMANVLPKQIVVPSTDAAAIERYRQSLADAETSFSRDAQKMGIGPAFAQYGSPDAINLGGPDTPVFLVGNQAIGSNVGGGAPPSGSPVSWGPEKTIVAASGDFGITIGYIVPNTPGADGKPQPGRPFFTIWRRDSPKDPWRYIAE